MKPITRRVLQAVLYESIAVVFVGPGLAFLFDSPAVTAISLAIFMSTVALGWSYVFNTLFERWERKQVVKGRSIYRRVAHAIFFEGGLVVTLVPVMAWWLNTSLLAAFLADLGVLAFFFVYALIFTWAFDKVFGLPASASGACEA